MEDSIRDCKLCDIFGTHVFDDRVMQERLPEETYRELKKVRQNVGRKTGGGGGQRHEGLGSGHGRYPLYPLVPATKRLHSGEI